MKLSEYLKPALGVTFVAVLAVGYYWFEHRPRAEEKDTPGQALVIVTKATNACFSDMVRVTGFIVPRREAQVGVDHLDVGGGPAQPGRLAGQVVLAQRGLGVLADLHQGGLADIHDRRALQVGAGHLRLAADHCRSPPSPARWPP